MEQQFNNIILGSADSYDTCFFVALFSSPILLHDFSFVYVIRDFQLNL